MLLITCFIFGLLGSLTWAGLCGQSVCPSGTFAFEDGSERNCYKFYKDNFTFEEAELWNHHHHPAATLSALAGFFVVGLKNFSCIDQGLCDVPEQECQYRWKGHLASFTNGRQATAIGAYVSKENIERNFVWIGLRRDEGSSLGT